MARAVYQQGEIDLCTQGGERRRFAFFFCVRHTFNLNMRSYDKYNATLLSNF